MARHKKWSFLWVLIPVIIVGIAVFFFINTLLNPNLYRRMVQESLSASLGRAVTIGDAKWNVLGGVGIAFEDFRVKDRSLAFDVLQAKRLVLKPEFLPLIRREIKWKRIILDRPVLHLVRDKNGQFNFLDGPLTGEKLKSSQKKILQALSTLFGGSMTIEEGEISFTDERFGDLPLTTEIKSFTLHLSKISYRTPFPFRLSGKISHSGKEGSIEIAGTLQNIPEDLDLSKGGVEAEVKVKGIEAFHFWPYLRTLLPIKTIAGNLDMTGQYKGDFSGPFKVSAKVRLKDVVFDHPQVFAYVLTPKWLNIGFEVNYDIRNLVVPSFSVELPEIWVKGKGKIYGIGSEGMGMDAEAQSGPFDLADGKRLVPYRIIDPGVSTPLFRGEGKGSVQIVSVKLSGKMPEIDHCDELANAHVLSVEMKLNGAGLKLPWNLPPLEDVKGVLLFKEGHLNLRDVEGRVLHSDFDNTNGFLYRLLRNPLLQVHSEGEIDLADLRSLTKTKGLPNEFSEAFGPMTQISGKAEYQLSVKGDLEPPFRFQHQGTYRLASVRLGHRKIPFPILLGEGKVDVSNEALQWSGVKVEFGNSALLMNGFWKRAEKSESLEIGAKGRADLKNLYSLFQSSLFPEGIRSATKEMEGFSGTADLSFKSRSLEGTPGFSYEGELIPRGVDFLRKGMIFPLTLKDGVISFSNAGFGFSKVRIQSGNSFLTLDGSAKEKNLNLSASGSIDLKRLQSLSQSPLLPDPIRSQMEGVRDHTGEADVRLRWFGKMGDGFDSLREGEIKLKGVSLQHQKIPVSLSHVEGSLLISREEVRFRELKGRLGDSPVTVSGAFSRSAADHDSSQRARPLSLQISSPKLNLDPLFPKKKGGLPGRTPTSFEGIRDGLRRWSINSKVEVDQGMVRGLLFQDLKGEMKTIGGKSFFGPLQFKAAGGDLWGEGWLQPSEKGIAFEMKPRISNMDAKALLRALINKPAEEKILLSGRVHVYKVELRGEGEDFEKIKESLSGSLRLEMENGVIERFSLLAKIFSILNVSQLFMGRVPDLKTKGLPYRQIIADIEIKKGVASVEDFLVDSDAMKITIVGKIDLSKNQIDARIGIHPLVAVDTVLSHIPIAGYILTGKDKAFLSYIYEVTGDLDDPKIEAIPFKSVGEGLVGIFRRLLETPLRPFQRAPGKE